MGNKKKKLPGQMICKLPLKDNKQPTKTEQMD